MRRLVAAVMILLGLVTGCSAAAAARAGSASQSQIVTGVQTQQTSVAAGTPFILPPPAPRAPALRPDTDPEVGVSLDPSKLDAFIAATGSTPSELSIYQDWADGGTFDDGTGKAAVAHGMALTVTWEPWAYQCNCVNQPSYSDRAIASGAHDAYIKAFAESVATFQHSGGEVITIRLAHEMNGNWYPWGINVNGNTAADYVAMWRHVHDIFAATTAKVLWEWAPNPTWVGDTETPAMYPGDAYVDKVALSGYNFGTGDSWSSWRSFDATYDYSLDFMHKIAPTKPFYIAEIGCAPDGGNKAAWITDMFAQIKARPYIKGFVWFDYVTQRDWLIEDNPAVLAAWKAGVASLQQ